ncbi:hypothetical protein D3C84_839470 [compost metagenome]
MYSCRNGGRTDAPARSLIGFLIVCAPYLIFVYECSFHTSLVENIRGGGIFIFKGYSLIRIGIDRRIKMGFHHPRRGCQKNLIFPATNLLQVVESQLWVLVTSFLYIKTCYSCNLQCLDPQRIKYSSHILEGYAPP